MNHSRNPHATQSQLVVFLLLLAANGCGKREAQNTAPTLPSRPAIVSAEKTSFKEVTAQLDAGGSLYGYLSTSQWLDSLSGRVNSWRDAVLSLPSLGVEEKSNVNKAFDLVTRLIRNSGVESINGVGVSGIAIEKGFYQTKFVVQRDTNSEPRGIWTVFGTTPRPLSELDWLPADTVWAGFSDVDLAALWGAVAREAEQAGFAEAKSGIDQLNGLVQQATGKKLDELFGSLGGRCGAFLALNETNKIVIPLPSGETLEVPEPGLVILIKVKNDTLFDWFDRALQANPQVVRADEGDLRMRVMPLPLPVPMTLRPTIARQGDYLLFASNDALIKNMMAVKAGKFNGLKTTAEFKHLAQGMPLEGNSFAFASQRLGDTMRQIQATILGQAHGPRGDVPAALLQKLSSINQPVSSFAVGRNTGPSWVTVGHGSQQPANAVVLPLVVAPSAVLAGLLLPALAKAKSKAQSISCVNNLKQMGLAARIYATDHNDAYPPDFLSMKNELTTPKILICPEDPKSGNRATLTWENFDPSQSSYEYVTRDLKESTPGFENKVLFRCRIHGHVCMGDGSVQMRNSAGQRN